MSLTALRDDIIVDPLYDPATVQTGLSGNAPGLYMPDSAKNPMSQQGLVVAVGPLNQILFHGDHILYHPFIQHPFIWRGHEFLHVKVRDIVGYLVGGELTPLPWAVVVRPDFGPAGRPVQEGSIWVPRQVFDVDVPCTGIVTKVGARVTETAVGERILFPPWAGNEIGLKRVWYTINERDILAILASDVKVTVPITQEVNQWQLK